ncbi:MAG TPA: SDR family oxidoreductase [Anaerolineales bacterium]|nr:SDR family oxidoreductase [Anaerolineales bacterium]
MQDRRPLEGKVAIITGASSGIGEASAREFARAGAHTMLAARREERLERLAGEIRAAGGTAIPVRTDLTDLSQITRLVRMTLAEYGRIDILANIAGWGRYDWIEELSPEDLRQQYEVNVLGMAELIRQVVPSMKSQKSGLIINMCSYASQISVPPLTIYASTKYAVEGLTDGLRRELLPWGVTVIRVHPSGVTGTEFNEHARKNGGITYRSVPVGRISREHLAKELVGLALHPRRTLFISRLYDLPVLVNKVFPGLVDAVSAAWVRRQRRKDLRTVGQVRPARYPSPFPLWQIAGGLAVMALVAGLLLVRAL